MSIKYYRLAKDEELPDEFCAVRDINGEPSEYTFYEQMNEFDRDLWAAIKQSDWFAGSEYRKLQAENAKLRELAVRMFHTIEWSDRMSDSMYWPSFSYERELRELGIEVGQ